MNDRERQQLLHAARDEAYHSAAREAALWESWQDARDRDDAILSSDLLQQQSLLLQELSERLKMAEAEIARLRCETPDPDPNREGRIAAYDATKTAYDAAKTAYDAAEAAWVAAAVKRDEAALASYEAYVAMQTAT